MNNQKTKYIIFVLLFCSHFIFSAMNNGATSVGLGNIQSVIENDVNTVFYNPANITSIQKYSWLISYVPLYGIENVYNLRTAFLLPLSYVHLGIGYNSLSAQNLYGESTFILSGAVQVQKFSFGSSVRYYMISLEKESSEMATVQQSIQRWQVDVGFSFHLNSSLLIAGTVENVNNQHFSFLNTKKDLRQFCLGTKIEIKKKFFVFAENQFHRMNPSVWNLGTEFSFVNVIYARMGISQLSQMTLGVGFHFPYVSVDFGLKANSDLGNLYQLDVTLKYE